MCFVAAKERKFEENLEKSLNGENAVRQNEDN